MKATEYQALLQHTTDMVIGLSKDHLILSYNHSAEKFYNCTASEAIGRSIFEFFALKGFKIPVNANFLNSPVQAEIDNETQNGYGKTCVVKWVICPIAGPKHQVSLLLIGKDISFKQTAIANNLFNIINCTPGSMYWKDKNGRYLGCNQFMIDTSGLTTVNDIVGKTDFDLWPDYAPILFDNDQHVIRTGKTVVAEETVKIPSGKLMHFTGIKMPLRDASNNIVGVIGNSLDITPLKVAQQELRLAKEAADKSNQLKIEFIRNMEHDIRTPFSGIYSMAQILEEQETNPEKKSWLAAITDCAKQLLDYCNGILDFSKLEAGNLVLISKKFNLRQLINDVISMEKPPAITKNLPLLLEYPKGIQEIFISDPFRIQRILINLVSNAIKFTDMGHVKIAVKIAKKTDAQNNIVEIRVEDTGIGIPTDKHTAIYEKFNRLTPSNQRFYKGSGLGLAIVKQLIEELNGEIELHSELNKGSIFSCLLPLKLPLIGTQENE